jgi:DMSO/TMAO reductase YedYZ heme-binding membrane subunit
MNGSFWRTIGYLVACILPLMIVHYILGLGAIGRPAWLMWPMLVLDAIVVAFLALMMAGSGLIAARWAAQRKNYPLIPENAVQLAVAEQPAL